MLNELVFCDKCNLHINRTQVVIGEGSKDANIMLVGECPGPDEDREGRPFIGRAGKILRKVLFELGVETDLLFITNIVKCFPKPSLNPSPNHIEACFPYLLAQIEQIKPQLIVSLGNTSTQFLAGKKSKITEISGSIQTTKPLLGKQYQLLSILHPSYILRGKMKLQEYAIHFLPMLSFYYNGDSHEP